tara:strand:+ start:1072 stop:1281 length:210 start_codon:yes stop_codon:yes gene_type:complete
MKIDLEGYESIRDRIKLNIIGLKEVIGDYNSNSLIVEVLPYLEDLDDIIETIKDPDQGWEIRSQEDAFD